MVAPSLDKITTFIPPKRTLMGPGPSDINPRVLSAMSLPVIGHLDPAFAGMMEELKVLLRYVFKTQNALTYPISGPGSIGMENCFVNMVSPGDKVIVCRNGVFGGRMIEHVERCGGTPIIIDDKWGEPVDPDKLEDALRQNPDARIVAFVHAETSTGCESDAKLLAQIAHKHDALVIVDAVTSLGGIPVLVDEWELDAVYSATQKCISCAPGLAPVTFSEKVVEYVKNRKTKPQSWFMDMNLILNYWGNTARTYHHTAPINALYGLHEALLLIKEEGLENVWKRHAMHYQALKAGFDAMGLRFL
ncbi:MAG: alanine--glyoxylate aminotransferase family protein, partial [Burkholderiaceae bacterium]|nr:alanine--glyoxylate aminotransferase family protein [Burkholderiaceae bacterium]